MQINKFTLLLILLGTAIFNLPLKAQVNVGSQSDPQAFSLLELTTRTQKGGLRLPQLTTEKRDALNLASNPQAAEGLVIYNTTTGCIEFWNGAAWVSLCTGILTQSDPSSMTICPDVDNTIILADASDGTSSTDAIAYQWQSSPDNSTWSRAAGASSNANYTITANALSYGSTMYFRRAAIRGTQTIYSASALITTKDLNVPTFMAYNLGADPTLDTPKKQMAYLANTGTGPTETNNGRVYGGRYQWGRKNLPYAISTDGNYTLYNGSTNSGTKLSTATYDSDGQIVTIDGSTPADNLFVNNDWRNEPKDDLWGNGVFINVPTGDLFPFNPGVPASDGNYYQSTTWVMPQNDPCPAGWRVPTQDEWERIGAYGCNKPNSMSTFVARSVDGTVPNTTSPFTWVPVKCSSGICTADATWTTVSTKGNVGYAIYKTVDWNAFVDKTSDLTASTAPQPFLFLPAAGIRGNSGANASNVGSSGYYHTAALTGIEGLSIRLALSMELDLNRGINFTAQYLYAGFSVRCVAE